MGANGAAETGKRSGQVVGRAPARADGGTHDTPER
jgi:hypothetical protein